MTPTRLPHVVRHYQGGGFATAFLGTFLMLFLSAGARALSASGLVSPTIAWALFGALALFALGGMYFFFSSETVAVVSDEGLKVTSQSRVGPLRGRLDTIVDVRWSAIAEVFDVTRSEITRHGNVQKHFELRFNQQPFSSGLLGTMQRDGLYLELIEAIRLAIGGRLVERDDLGGLDAAVRRVIAEPRREGAKGSARGAK